MTAHRRIHPLARAPQLVSRSPTSVQESESRSGTGVNRPGHPEEASRHAGRRGLRAKDAVRVLLVDDHMMMREGLCAVLADLPDIEVVGQASDGQEALDLVRTLSPDVVVMDVGMPELNGVEATRRIRAEHERVKVIALSTHTDKRYVQQMLEAGACGYVLKIAAHDELVQAVRAASLGRTYLSPNIAGLVIERSTTAYAGGDVFASSSLGVREREALQLVSEGKTSAETAKEMHISIKTVETYRRNIVRKLGLHGTAELTKYAVREGLTSLDS